MSFAADTWQQLQLLSAPGTATPIAPLLAGLNILLFRYSGQTDVVVGTALSENSNSGSNEGARELLALRTQLNPQVSVKGMVTQIERGIQEASAHSVSLHSVLAALGRHAGDRGQALFDVALVFSGPMSQREDPGLSEHLMDCALVLHAAEADDEVALRYDYDAEIFERATIERLAGHFQNLLQAMADHPDERLEQLEQHHGRREKSADWEAIRRATNHKISPQALPGAISENDRDFEPPATELETGLAALWSELLQVENISRHDDFFELGGHSLLAMQLVARARDRFAVDLPLKNLFESPTLAGLAEVIEALSWTKKGCYADTASTPRDEVLL